MSSFRDLKQWREEVGRNLLNLDFRTEGDHPFRFQMRAILVGTGMRVFRNSHGSGFTVRDHDLVRDGNDALAIVFPTRGALSFTQAGGGVLHKGDAKLLLCGKPGQLGAATPSNYVSVIFPPEILPTGTDICRLARAPWRGATPAFRLLRSYVDSLKDAIVEPNSDLAMVTHRHLTELVRFACIEFSQRDGSEMNAAPTIAEARVRIARDNIAKHFRDPNLDARTIASQQGISTRHLQRLFESAGSSFTEEVNALRLETCYAELTGRRSKALPVIEIALAVGFNDLSHFYRMFRRRYGMTPREVRSGRTRKD